jgi:hypothetical protein
MQIRSVEFALLQQFFEGTVNSTQRNQSGLVDFRLGRVGLGRFSATAPFVGNWRQKYDG